LSLGSLWISNCLIPRQDFELTAMAVIGHWVVSFFLAYLCPSASVTVLCKMAMMSDVTAGILILAKVETATVFPWYLSTPPPSTNATLETWKATGQWLPGVDRTVSEGFQGFAALFPVYLDIPYSHTVEGMAILGLVVAVLGRLFYGIGIGYATAIVLSAVSHVILDMFFHDAYIFCGNRAVSRVTVNFWQIYNMEPVAFLLECILAYGGYRLWWSTRMPLSTAPESSEKIAYYKRMFWSIALTHNMASFYVWSPLLIFVAYKYAPSLQFFTPACYWSFIIFTVGMWSWSVALYPLHKLQALTCTKDTAGVEVDEYRKIPCWQF